MGASNTKEKRGFGQRVNAWLAEAPGKTFKDGKWRFWFPALVGLGLFNAVLTGLIFGQSGSAQTYMGGIVLAVGALLAWLGVGALHYSDEVVDAQLARGVSALDSATLLFVVAHFCFLLWVYGHLATLQNAENSYKVEAEKFNAKAEAVSQDNVKIAEAARAIAAEATKAERLKNDTAYQTRKAAEAGARLPSRSASASASAIAPSLSTAPIQLERPKAPEESSTKFLSEWDKWIRATNFGEILLAVITLIYIRNRSAKFNAQYAPTQMNFRGERTYRVLPDGRREIIHSSYSGDEIGKIVEPDEDFPSEIDAGVKDRKARSDADIQTVMRKRSQPPGQTVDDNESASPVSLHSKDRVSTRVETQADGLQKLRAYLKEISFYHPGYSFKVDVKTDYVWLRMMRSQKGREETIASTKVAPIIIDDAAQMEPDAFRERIATYLKKKGFPIKRRE
jgi:hypothetical protein